ncbi:MAG: hypothetical protein ACP5N1_05740 [Candidatus Woesearchaeota archaeon]
MMFENYFKRREEKRKEKQEIKEKETLLEKQIVDTYDKLVLFPGNKAEFEECFKTEIEIVDIPLEEKFITAYRRYKDTYSEGSAAFYFGDNKYIYPYGKQTMSATDFIIKNNIIALIHYRSRPGTCIISEGTGVPVIAKNL